MTWTANASLSSQRSMSSIFVPVCFNSFGTANTGPMPISLGSQPATANPRKMPSGGGPQLTAHAVLVLPLARDTVLLRHVLRRLQHRPIELRLVLDDPVFVQHVRVHLVLHARDGLDSARGVDLALAAQDALRGDRDRLQPRGAEAVDRHAGGRDGTAGAD